MKLSDRNNVAELSFKEKFGSREYLTMYYPQILEMEVLLDIAHLMHVSQEEKYVIDTLAEKTNTRHEMIENVAIFNFYRTVVEHLLQVFPEGNARILDIGGGPTIYQHIGLAIVAKHITHSEFLETNRTEVIAWLNNEDTAYAWDPYFELVKKLFSFGEIAVILKNQKLESNPKIVRNAKSSERILNAKNVDLFKKMVRKTIKGDVVYGDIFQSDLGLLQKPGTFDIVTSNFVVESVATDLDQWQLGMENTMKQIREKGFFILIAIKNALWYQVGSHRISAVRINKDNILECCEKSGFKIIYQKVLEGSNFSEMGYDGMIFILAQRI